MKLRLESAATECELLDCGTFSIRRLVSALMTPSAAEPGKLPMLAKFLVLALMTSVLVLVGTFCGVQPSSRLSCGPTVAPFGPHSLSGNTPVLVAALKAPITATGRVRVVGSITSMPPWQKLGPPKVQPGGLLAICGTET